MINKKMIPGIIVFVILIIVMIIIAYNCNKKNKENVDKLQQCNSKLELCKPQLKDNQHSVNILKQQLQKSLNDKQMVISNLEKQNKFKLAKTRHFSKKHGITYEKTMNLLKSNNISLVSKGRRTMLGSGTTLESIEEQLSEIKGDMHANDAAEQCGQIADQTVDFIGALYEGIQDGFTPESKEEIAKSVGVGLINIFFACSGLGFLIGPFTNLVSIFGHKGSDTSENSGEQIAEQLFNSIKGLSNYTQINNDINQVTGSITNITSVFLKTQYNYVVKYMSINVLCPDPTSTSGNSSDIITCMENKNYDPSAVINDPNRGNKRNFLLSGTSNFPNNYPLYTSELDILVNNKYVFESGGKTPTGILDNLFTSYNTTDLSDCFYSMVNGYALYVNIIQLHFIYYQEEAIYTLNADNNNNYYNPYSNIQSPIIVGLNTLSQVTVGTFTQTGILGTFYTYIQNIFIMYIRQCLSVAWWTSDNTQCCSNHKPNWTGGCKDPNCTGDNCDQNKGSGCIWYSEFRDSCTLLNDSSKTGKNFYQLMCAKYNLTSDQYGPTVTFGTPNVQFNDQSGLLSFFNQYLVFFNEFMNFPLDTYLMYMKICGYNVVDQNTGHVMTSSDLFNSMMWDVYNYCNTTYGKNGGMIVSDSIQTFQIANNNPFKKILAYSEEGPYPFGLNRPSFKTANTSNTANNTMYTCNDTSNDCLVSTDLYNNYCTPAVPISPGSYFDATIFNLPGDIQNGGYTQNMSCVDSEGNISSANIVKSCVFPGVSPGNSHSVNNQGNGISTANPGTRTAYCINTTTGEFSTLKDNGALPSAGQPTVPSSGTKCWDIPNPTPNGDNPFATIQLQLGSGGWTSSSYGLSNISWSGSTMTCQIGSPGDTTITFDNYQRISALGGSGNYFTQNLSSPIPYYIVNINIFTSPTNGYKCWDLLGDGSSIFRVDSSGNQTYNGIVPSYVGHQGTTVQFTVSDPSSNHQQFYLNFGANESIYGGKIDGTYLLHLNPIPNTNIVNIQPYITSGRTAAPIGSIKKWVLQTNSAVSAVWVNDGGGTGQGFGNFGVCYNGAGGCGPLYYPAYSNGILTEKFSSKYPGTQDSFVVYGQNEDIVYGQYAGQPLIGLPYSYQIIY